ncbi:TIM-barrel domain-containing protein [Mucisphaera calidilacus]|uniref:Alpha-xylosidase n=1 Tax=Mucisphaera calidilacus TaxID=2527982 RepID=A0A518BYG7_9BACT|nr:TIM-barrel domain-containing protein [Mucisphaera calidilacus]QDU72019.1 Alpha-xylosidase [Mucisphaera calidilacus]
MPGVFVRLVGCVLVLLGAVLPAWGQAERYDLSDGWTFMAGDDPSWSTQPPAERVPIEVGMAWEAAGYPEMDGFGWYFLEFEASAKLVGQEVIWLHLGRIDDADETFLNGDRIGGMGKIDGSASAWDEERRYRLKAGLLREGVNRLAVRVNDTGFGGGMFSGAPHISAYSAQVIETTLTRVGDRGVVALPSDRELADHPMSPAFVLSPYTAEAIGDPMRLPEARFTRLGERLRVDLDVDLDAVDLYGTGMVTGPLLRDGTFVRFWNTDNYRYGRDRGRRLYQSHPWVLGLRADGSAFGVLFDTTWRASLDLKAGMRLQTDAPSVPVYMFERETVEEVLEHLAALTGTIEMPPLWALGFQQSRFSYINDAMARKYAREFRRRRLPVDVLWFDIDYMRGFRVFTYNARRFPDPAATNAYLHDLNFKAVWMLNPGVKLEPDKGYGVYDSGTKRDIWVKDASGAAFIGKVWAGESVFPDFTMPEARDWWASMFPPFIAKGVDGVWNDMNEPAVFGGPDATMPVDARHRGGEGIPPGSHLQHHNIYGMMMARATREGMLRAQPDRRPFVLTRANFLGGHRYAATWTGDNAPTDNHMRLSIPMCLSLGLSGQPFVGPDIGGFDGHMPKDAELFRHWISVGAFYPFSRCHFGGKGTQPDREPWTYDDETENIARVALERRYRLLPYLYTCFREASVRGLPVMRPVFMADPTDLKLRGEERAFMVGGDLLVIPRWAESPAVPAGDWRPVSLLEGDIEEDGYQVELRQRPGSVIPLGPVVQHTVDYRLDPLTLSVHLNEQGMAEGFLYEDAYNGFGYRDGAFRLTRVSAWLEGDEVRVRMAVEEGQWPEQERRVRVRVVGRPGVAVRILP